MKTIAKKAKDIHEYVAWLADYINALPDKCPHKDVLKNNYEILNHFSGVINEILSNEKLVKAESIKRKQIIEKKPRKK